MNHFYVFNFNRNRRILLLVFLAFITALFILVEPAKLMSVFSQKDQQTALTKGNESEDNIAFTFNISWGEEKVYDILRVLKEHDVRATFFVSGEWAERHPQIMEEISDHEHEVGMLGYRYKNYLDQEIEQVRRDITYAKEVFNKLGYREIKYIRPPSGHFNEEVIDIAERSGLEVIHWSVNPRDWESPGVNEISEKIMEDTTSGDIILLHASDSAKQTAEALENVIPALKKQKFSFVTISELINEVKAEEELVE